MTRAGLKTIARVLDQKKADQLVIPPAIQKALNANKEAGKNFKNSPLPYKRIRLAFIESRERHGSEFYKKSLHHFIEEMKELKNIDVAFICMNMPYTMDVNQASAVLAFKPKIVYPFPLSRQ